MNAQTIDSIVSENLHGLLNDKTAIITGASRGIGAATAQFFAKAGAHVVLAARDKEKLDEVANEIHELGGEALAVPTDITDQDAVTKLVNAVVQEYGQLDIAFNNAAGGGHRPMPLAEVTLEDFDSAFQVILRGTFLSMKYEIPAMLEAGGGAIVNMASTAGVRGHRGLAAYATCKHGVVGLAKIAALDYAEKNIRVNVVAPGPILTHNLARLDDETQNNIAERIPVKRLGQPEKVAATVAWLCSEESSFVTGATIPIDGGQLAGGI